MSTTTSTSTSQATDVSSTTTPIDSHSIHSPTPEVKLGTNNKPPRKIPDPTEEYFFQQTKLFDHLEKRFEKFKKRYKEDEKRAKAGKFESSSSSSSSKKREDKKSLSPDPIVKTQTTTTSKNTGTNPSDRAKDKIGKNTPGTSEPKNRSSTHLKSAEKIKSETKASSRSEETKKFESEIVDHPSPEKSGPRPQSQDSMSGSARRAILSVPSVASTSRTLSTSIPNQARIASSSSSKKRTPVNPDAMNLSEAIRILRALEISNPASAYSLTLTTRYSKSSLPLRGRVSLPIDARKAPEIVLVFAEPDSPSAEIAKIAGAHIIGGEELFAPILNGEIQPTKVLTTPSLLGPVQRSLARFLGPKGLMPTAKRGGVGEGEELGKRVREAAGLMEWKADKLGVVRAPVARMPFTIPNVDDNVRAFITAVKDAAAAQSAAESSNSASRSKKVSGIITARLETTNGPSIELNDVL